MCPYEDRPKDVCYNCWKPGHSRKSCSGPKYFQKLKKTVAAVTDMNAPTDWNDEDEDGAKSLSALSMVSVAFIDVNNQCSEGSVTRLSLFDTGSPANLIRRSAVPFKVRGDLTETQFCGLGRTPIKTYGKIYCDIIIRNRCERICLLVVPDEMSPKPILLGRIALAKFGIALTMIDRKILNVVSKAQNKLNGTLENKKDELYFCSLGVNISERVAIANIEPLPSALLKREEKINLINVSTKISAANVSNDCIEPEETIRSASLSEKEIMNHGNRIRK